MSNLAAALRRHLWPREVERRFVVLHIPKTAGTSLHSSLISAFGESAVSPLFDHATFMSASSRRLRRYRVVQGHLSFSEALAAFPGRSHIVFLRDPCERCLSWYYYLRRQPLGQPIPLSGIRGENSAREAISLAKHFGPHEFFSSGHPHVLQNVQDRQVYQLGDRIPMNERSRDRSAVLQRAIGNLRRIEFLGLQENYGADLQRLTAWLGAPQELVHEAANVTDGRPATNGLPDSVRDVLLSLNELDLQLYAAAQSLVPGGMR